MHAALFESDSLAGGELRFDPVIGEIKRFLELWTALPAFKELAQHNPVKAAEDYHLKIDPREIQPLYDRACARETSQNNWPVSDAVRKYRQFIRWKIQWRAVIKEECSPDDPRFQAWRARQIARNVMQCGAEQDEHFIHTPISFELTRGCSVGCWFCAFAAAPLSDVFPYTPEHARLWRDILKVAYDVIGPSARWGANYFSTEPLDNPDYEKFCDDFHDILGMFPQTTTAVPMRDPARTRALLELSSRKGTRVNRFSILSTKLLKQVYAEFSAAELTAVELIIQSAEGDNVKAAVGRFNEKSHHAPHLLEREQEKLAAAIRDRCGDDLRISPGDMTPHLQKTICCLSGFLVNLPERSIRLISPIPASQRWPLGFILYDQRTFTSAGHFKQVLEQMIDDNMRLRLDGSKTVRFRGDLTYQALSNGFQVFDRNRGLKFDDANHGAYLRYLGKLLQQGTHRANDIALLCVYQYGVTTGATMKTLNTLFDHGILDEEPFTAASSHA